MDKKIANEIEGFKAMLKKIEQTRKEIDAEASEELKKEI
jgi:hypothetical protein